MERTSDIMSDIRFKISTSNTSLDVSLIPGDVSLIPGDGGGVGDKRGLSICSMNDLTTIKRCKHNAADEKKNRAHFIASIAIAKFRNLSSSSSHSSLTPTKVTTWRRCSLSPHQNCPYSSSSSSSVRQHRSPSVSSAPNSPVLTLRRYKHSRSMEDVVVVRRDCGCGGNCDCGGGASDCGGGASDCGGGGGCNCGCGGGCGCKQMSLR